MTNAEQCQKYYYTHKEQCKKTVARWRAANPEKCKLYSKRWATRNKDKLAKRALAYARKRPEHYAMLARRSRRKIRTEFLVEYGGKCNCCGESEFAFLTLEHKNRDGKSHRNQYGTSTQILADLRRRGWPKENYEVLCFNCNRATWELGLCPHRQRKLTEIEGEANE